MERKAYFSSIAALALVMTATPALASAKSKDQAGDRNAVAIEDKGERKICKRFDNSASRMKSTRLCLTKAEWKKFEATD